MNNNIVSNSTETSHILYSRGYVFDDFDYLESLKKISEATQQTEIEVQEKIICCRKKRLTSSTDLKKLIALEKKFKSLGLDVYIQLH